MMPMGLDPNADRNPNIMPTQSPFMKYVSPYPRKTSALNPGQIALAKKNEAGKKAVASMTGKTVEEVDTALPRKMKYCGGTSKPYGKKK